METMSDTPRSNEACATCHGFGIEFIDSIAARFVSVGFARQLERELSAATTELAATKEQLRVAREQIRCAIETMELCRGGLDCGEYSAVDESLANAAYNLKPFTQPNLSADSLGGGNPAKGEGGVPSTFPA